MRKEGEKEFDIHDYMSETTVEILLETAMGVSKTTQDRSGFEYAMAVMKMSDILHLRHTRLWLRPDWLFNLTKYGKDQIQLLEIIHGLTKKVIKRKKEDYKAGKRNFITDSKEAREAKATSIEGLSFGQSSGLKDDLDVDDNDVGEKKRLAFLDLLMEAGQNGTVLNEQEVKEQVDTIMFEVRKRDLLQISSCGAFIIRIDCSIISLFSIAGSRYHRCWIQLFPFNDGMPPRDPREGYQGVGRDLR